MEAQKVISIRCENGMYKARVLFSNPHESWSSEDTVVYRATEEEAKADGVKLMNKLMQEGVQWMKSPTR
jgi:hypothetical protein